MVTLEILRDSLKQNGPLSTLSTLAKRLQMLRNLMTSTLLEKHTAMDTHTPDNWDNLAVDVTQPLRGRYATNPLAQAMRPTNTAKQASNRLWVAPLTAVPTAGTLLPTKPKQTVPSSLVTENTLMISPIAPKKALQNLPVASVSSPIPMNNAVQRFQELEELSPLGLMWQLVKDAMGIRSQAMPALQIVSPLETAAPVANPTYAIRPFKKRFQQRLNQVDTAVNPTPADNPFSLLPLQWASAPPLQTVVRKEALPPAESVWF